MNHFRDELVKARGTKSRRLTLLNGRKRQLTFEALESRRVLATTLGLGDVAFTGYQGTTTDKVSIVLLRDVDAGTIITMTDNAWGAVTGQLATNEGSSTLTINGVFLAGTQLNFDLSRTAGSRWANGTSTTNLSDVTGSNFAFSGSGDNLFLYNGSVAPASATSSLWIAAFATNNFQSSGDASSNLTYLPSIFTVGDSAFSLGIANGTANPNGVYIAGSFTGSSSATRAQVHNISNWTTFTTAGAQNIPPTAVFTISNGANTPPTIVSNLGISVRANTFGNTISGDLLNSIDSQQSPAQLTYRVTTLPSLGSLRLNSVLVVANTTTFTQADINSGRLTYDAPSNAADHIFAFSVSDGVATVTGSFALRVLPNLLLNELKVNPPGNAASGNRFQYIELRGTAGLSLTNVVIVMLDGNGVNAGRTNYVMSLTGRTLGTNGLLLIKSPTGGHTADPNTAIVTDSLFDTTVGGVLSKQTVSFYLGVSTTAIGLGIDFDSNNDGTLELLPAGFTVLDTVGWSDGDAGDIVYGGVSLTQSGGTPDAATRFNANSSTSTAAWYNGDLFDVGNDPAQLLYDVTRSSANLPRNPTIASITPGAVNFSARPVVITNTGLSVALGTTNTPILGVNLAAGDSEFPVAQLIYRVTTLPLTGILKLSGANVVANNTLFSQADIDAGRLTLDAAATAGSASFTFSVSNGIATTTAMFLLGYRALGRTNLRVVSYNIASEGGAPRPGLDTILQAIGTENVSGISRPIDVLALQEVLSQSTTSQSVAALLNNTYGTVAYATGTLNGATTGAGTQGVVFNSSTVQLMEEIALGTATSTGPPRQTLRYRFRPVGTTGSLDFYLYNSHFKSADDSVNEGRRLSEVQIIRANADSLGSGVQAIYAGDFNMYRSTETGYQAFLATGNGRAVDPINSPGNWHNNSNFVGIFTQAPAVNPPAGFTAGGLDDRFDFQLISSSLQDGVGLEYSPNSYRSFGNNGSVPRNGSINSASSTALPGLANRTTVLNLLTTVTDHLPVVADYFFGSAAANVTPTDIGLSNALVAENTASGSNVGTFTSTDPNVGDVHTYLLVSGTGSTDNSRFIISGNQLQTSVNANLDGPRNYSIRVRSTDQSGLFFEKIISIASTNVPPNITVANAAITGNEGTTLSNSGTFSDVISDTVSLSASSGTVVNNGNGSWSWTILPGDNTAATSVTITAQDEDGGSAAVSFTYTATNLPPLLSVNTASLSGNVLTVFANSGLYSDVAADTVLLSASIGTVVKNTNGTWNWSATPTATVSNQLVTITATDEDGGSSNVTFTINALVAIAGRGVFYNGATGADASSSLGSDKVPLLPGQSSTFANYTNYSRGLNGVVIDIAGLPASTTNAQLLSSLQLSQWNGISAGGFAALPIAAVPTVSILTGLGASGATRVRITFPDNSLQNTWLRIIVLANAITGLASNDVFYFGNVIGEVNSGNTATRLRVNATDTGAVRSNQSTSANSASVTNIYDINRDGRVNATDTGLVRSNQQTAGIVAPITAPASLPSPSSSYAAPPPKPPEPGFYGGDLPQVKSLESFANANQQEPPRLKNLEQSAKIGSDLRLISMIEMKWELSGTTAISEPNQVAKSEADKLTDDLFGSEWFMLFPAG